MAVNVCNYGYHFFMTRWLGPASYGVLSSVVALMLLSGVPALIATSVIVKYAAEFSATGADGKVHALYVRAVWWLGAIASILVALSVLYSGEISAFLRLNDPGLVIIASFGIALGLAIPAFRGVLQGVQDFSRLAVSTAVEGLGKAILGVLLTVVGFGLRGAVAGYAAGTLIALTYSYFALTRYRVSMPAAIGVAVGGLLKATTGVAAAILGTTLLSSIDLILVKHFFPPEQAGIYAAASLAGKVLLFVGGFIPPLVLPKVAARNAQGSSASSILLLSIAMSAALSAVGLLCTALMPHAIIRLFAGASYDGAASILLPYAAAMAVLAMLQIASNYLIGVHRYRFAVVLLAGGVAEIVAIAICHQSLTLVTYEILGIMLSIGFLIGLLTYSTCRTMN